jgi:hypothetical protein
MVELTEQSKDQTGKIYYEPLILQVAQASQYNANKPPDQHAWRFGGLENYWNSRTTLVEGNWYKVQLATKDHGTAHPYRDVMQVRVANPDEIPDTPPPATNGARNGSSGSQDEYRRSKEEMRWTEAYHMATRITVADDPDSNNRESNLVGWAGWFYNELVRVGSTPPEQPEETEERIPAEDDGMPF